jgi:hypothetical protein
MVIFDGVIVVSELGRGMQRQQQAGDVEARRKRVKGTGEIDGGAGAYHCEGRRLPGCGQVGHLGEPQVGRLAGAADEQDRRAVAGAGR